MLVDKYCTGWFKIFGLITNGIIFNAKKSNKSIMCTIRKAINVFLSHFVIDLCNFPWTHGRHPNCSLFSETLWSILVACSSVSRWLEAKIGTFFGIFIQTGVTTSYVWLYGNWQNTMWLGCSPRYQKDQTKFELPSVTCSQFPFSMSDYNKVCDFYNHRTSF